MAQLKTLLKGRQKSRLGLTSEEDLQSLSAKRGRALPPTQPAEAAQLGANPDQSKMAGSSANLKATLQKAASAEAAPSSPAVVEESQTLQEAQRLRQARTERTSAEEQQRQLAERLAQSSGHLVQQTGEAAKQKLAEAGRGPEQRLQLKSELQISPDQQSQVDILLDPNRSESERAAAFNQLQGVIPAGLSLQDAIRGPDAFASTWMAQVRDINEQLATTAAAAAADEVLVSDLYAPEEMEALGQDLGLSLEELQGMSAQDLQQAFDAQISEEFSSVERLRAIASDPAASPADRQEALQQLEDLGAVDVVALEEDEARQLAADIEAADEIEIAGNTYTVEELLDDEEITALITNYLETGEGEEVLKELELFNWVDTNRGLLERAAASVEDSTKRLAEKQKATYEKAQLAAEVMGVDADQLFGSKFLEGDLDFPLANVSDDVLKTFAGKDFGPELAEFNEAELEQLARRADLIEQNAQARQTKELASSGDPNVIMNNMMDMISEFRRLERAGAVESSAAIDAIDKNKDGLLDGDWMSTLTNQPTSLRDILEGRAPSYVTAQSIREALGEAARPENRKMAAQLDDTGSYTIEAINEMDINDIISESETDDLFTNPKAAGRAATRLLENKEYQELLYMGQPRDAMLNEASTYNGPDMRDTVQRLVEIRDHARKLREDAQAFPVNSPKRLAMIRAANEIRDRIESRIAAHNRYIDESQRQSRIDDQRRLAQTGSSPQYRTADPIRTGQFDAYRIGEA